MIIKFSVLEILLGSIFIHGADTTMLVFVVTLIIIEKTTQIVFR